MEYGKFLNAVVTPWWAYRPLDWEIAPGGPGIAAFARDGKVGLFNLSWWMLGLTEPPKSGDKYINDNLRWAILRGPYVKIEGYNIQHHAAMKTQREFNHMVCSVAVPDTMRAEWAPALARAQRHIEVF